jgi:hypothetical protein
LDLPKHSTPRVTIWKRLNRIGAVAVQRSVYALPQSAASLRTFREVRTEVGKAGGQAAVCQANFIEGLSERDVRDRFIEARNADFDELLDQLRTLEKQARRGGSSRLVRSGLKSVRRRRELLAEIDFFGAPRARELDSALAAFEEREARSKRGAKAGAKAASAGSTRGKAAPARGRSAVKPERAARIAKTATGRSAAATKAAKPSGRRPSPGARGADGAGSRGRGVNDVLERFQREVAERLARSRR